MGDSISSFFPVLFTFVNKWTFSVASFIAGAKKYFPTVEITFDKFHVMKVMNTAVDETRRKEQQTVAELKNSRYSWLKNEQNLTKKQKEKLIQLKDEVVLSPYGRQ